MHNVWQSLNWSTNKIMYIDFQNRPLVLIDEIHSLKQMPDMMHVLWLSKARLFSASYVCLLTAQCSYRGQGWELSPFPAFTASPLRIWESLFSRERGVFCLEKESVLKMSTVSASRRKSSRLLDKWPNCLVCDLHFCSRSRTLSFRGQWCDIEGRRERDGINQWKECFCVPM